MRRISRPVPVRLAYARLRSWRRVHSTAGIVPATTDSRADTSTDAITASDSTAATTDTRADARADARTNTRADARANSIADTGTDTREHDVLFRSRRRRPWRSSDDNLLRHCRSAHRIRIAV